MHHRLATSGYLLCASVTQCFKSTREGTPNRRAGLPARLPLLTSATNTNHRALMHHRLATSGYLLCASVSMRFKTTRDGTPNRRAGLPARLPLLTSALTIESPCPDTPPSGDEWLPSLCVSVSLCFKKGGDPALQINAVSCFSKSHRIGSAGYPV